jgi:hypothetical protein
LLARYRWRARALCSPLAIGGTAYAIQVPELDPGTAASGVALFVGGVLLLIERHRRRR